MNRVVFLDVSKGLGIILVIIGHTCTVTEITKFIYSFHMPLFFLISGITTKNSVSNHFDFLKKKIKNLIFPYLFWYFFSWVYWCLLERSFRHSNIDPFNSLLAGIFCLSNGEQMIPNIVLWFLPTLFVLELFGSLIEVRISHLLISIFLIFFLSLWHLEDFVVPFGILQALIALPFYLFGILFKKKLLSINRLSLELSFLSIIILTIVLLYTITLDSSVDIRTLHIGNPLLYLLNGFLGTLIILMLSHCIENVYLFSQIGTRTLTIMVLHEPFKRILIYLLSKQTHQPIDYIRTSWVYVIMIAIIIVFVLIYVDKFLKTYLPYSLGKFQK